ncbi:hypothetical protein [Streptomyces olivochromogenes]|uniref:hypothetical protein n=1 Tax=Streptomyces olivochromogenes TaxID=1963 RepID=UPI003675B628
MQTTAQGAVTATALGMLTVLAASTAAFGAPVSVRTAATAFTSSASPTGEVRTLTPP